MRGSGLRWLGAALALAMTGAPRAADGPRHVPSPDWRDQIVYFAMLDRFDDGDPSNNDQGAGEYDPADRRRYSGGDLRGLARRLDYVQGLGATAVWITPPVAHQWWNTRVGYGGYHGYWADDFTRVDPHFGTLEDYRALAGALHGRGMYLVQDVVVNHVADYFGYPDGVDPADPARGLRIVPDARGQTAPTQAPFHLNDPRRAADRAAGVYHWTPDIRDYADPVQEKTWQMAGLDDLDTENPLVRRTLRASYAHWIREVGVDAFRVDTAFYVPPEFFDDFLHARDPAAPGILQVARGTGREAFHVFGEGFGIDRAFDDAQARKIESYSRDAAGRDLLPGMINFPLHGSLLDVLARGRPTAELADRIERVMRVHARPHLMPTFLDNHDVDRFLAGGNEAALRQGLLALMTLPGIPTIYYGTEQGFAAPRAAMFAGGYGSGGRDRFDTSSPGYRYLQRAIALRRGHRVFSRGVPTVLAHTAAGPGALAWRMDGEGGSAVVALNTAEHPVLLDALAIGPRTRLVPLFAIEGQAPQVVADAEGRAALVLPPRAGYAWRLEHDGAMPAPPGPMRPALDAVPAEARGAISASGRGAPLARLRLVVDGDLSQAVDVRTDAGGRWRAQVPTAELVDPAVPHRLVAFDPSTGQVSAAREFRVQRQWRPAARVDDPTGDDTGPSGTYRYPTDPGWGANHQADIEAAEAWTDGGALRLDLTMRSLTRSWNPANGFDHVAFTVYIELPGRDDGATHMPLQHSTLPGGMRWHRRLRVGGWSNLLTAPDAVTPDSEGLPVVPGAQLEVDAAQRRVRLTLPPAALGRPRTLRGARVHVTTWDFDAGYRAIAAAPGSHSFGGGSADAPRVMDAVTLELR